jgi:DNA-binding NtrC family response regulator
MNKITMKVLLVDDEPTIRMTLTDDLEDNNYVVTAVEDGTKAADALRKDRFDFLITDIRMPGMDGFELLKHAKNQHPDTKVIVITGYASFENTRNAFLGGAINCFQKPFSNEEIVDLLDSYREVLDLRNQEFSSYGLIGTSKAMQEVYRKIAAVSQRATTVLISGKTGTGKELVARAVHNSSKREPFVALNCAAIAPSIIEDELFGHERGSFSGAEGQRSGYFESADRGTIFLDEIDDMPLDFQVKLLRVLQEKRITRLGSTKEIHTDARVIAASKKDLSELVREGKFREDLFYRLNVFNIDVPPLRERIEDIPKLAEHFVVMYGEGRIYQIPSETLDHLKAHSWPGNVRQLQFSIENAIINAGESSILKPEYFASDNIQHRVALDGQQIDLSGKLAPAMAKVEKAYIEAILRIEGHVTTKAAERLGISRKCLWEKRKIYGIEK